MNETSPGQNDSVIEQIEFDQAFNYLQSVFAEYFETWLSESQRMFTDQTNQIKQRAISAFSHNEPAARDSENLIRLWQELKNLFGDMTKYADFEPYAEYGSDGLLVHWSKHFNQSIQKLIPTVRLSQGRDILEPNPADGIWIRFQKKIENSHHQFSSGSNWLKNRFRKTPVALPLRYRTFSVRDFAAFYGSASFATFMFQEWEVYLQFIRVSVDTIRQLIKEIGVSFLFEENSEPRWATVDSKTTELLTDECVKKLETLDTLNLSLASALSQSRERFQTWAVHFSETWDRNERLAGTLLLPKKRFSRYRHNKINLLTRRNFLNHQRQWIDHLAKEGEDWQEELLLFQLIFKVGEACLQTVATIREDVKTRLVPAIQLAGETISQTGQRIKAGIGQADLKLAASNLKDECVSLDRTLKKELLPPMVNLLIRNRSVPALSAFSGEAQRAVDTFPEKMRVFRRKDMTSVPPSSEATEVPIRALFDKHILNEFNTGMGRLLEELKEQIEGLLILISEVEQIVSFTNSTAQDLAGIEPFDPESTQTTIDGLGRAGEKTIGLSENLRTAEELAESNLTQTTDAFIREVHQLINNEKLIELHFQIIRSQLKLRFLSARKIIWHHLKTALPLSLSFAMRLLNCLKESIRKLRSFTGFLAPADNLEKKLQRQLAKTWLTIETLPFIYQNLFRLDPLVNDQFFSLREREMAQLEDQFRLWRESQYSVAAIVGERGAGKTTLVNMAETNIFKPCRTVWISPSERHINTDSFIEQFKKEFPDFDGEGFDELEQHLLNLKKPVVCVIKKIHLLFLKTIDGFDLIEQLLLLIDRTSRKVFWIVICNQHSWSYLDKVINIENHFSGIIQFSNLTVKETEDLIQKRHQVTGYKLVFEAGQQIQSSRRYKKASTEEEKQLILKEKFFEQLRESAQGNMALAILFWLISIKGIDQNKMIISAEINLDYEFFNQLSQDELFSLGSLVQHELLSEEDHAKIFLQDDMSSRQQLKILANKGILVEEKPGQYKVNLVVYRPLVQKLKRHKILF